MADGITNAKTHAAQVGRARTLVFVGSAARGFVPRLPRSQARPAAINTHVQRAAAPHRPRGTRRPALHNDLLGG
jgi:hypothetical protein